MPWKGKVRKPFGDEPSHLLTQPSLTRGAELMIDHFRSSLGPKGALKLIIRTFPMRDEITSDGKTILTSMGAVHPGAWLMREMAYTQIGLGDGVITTLVFTGELLKNSKKLLTLRVKPSVIIYGYHQAKRFSVQAIREISRPVTLDRKDMMKVARTAAGTKPGARGLEKISELAVIAVESVVAMDGGKPDMDMRDICVIKALGGKREDTRLVRGTVLQRGLRHPGMPRKLENPRIALLTCGLEFKKFWEEKFPMKVEVLPGKMDSIRENRLKIVRQNVDRLVETGANLVVTSQSCDELHASMLAERGIQLVHHIPEMGGVGRLAKASGGTAVGVLNELEKDDLGRAGVAEEVRIPRMDTRRLEREMKGTDDPHPEEEKIFVVDGCDDPRSVTILIRGEMEAGLNETERALDAALSSCQAIVRKPRVVGGAGAVEAELAHRVRRFALEFDDKTQLAVVAYADALDALVETLAHNSGLDPIDAKAEMRAAHADGKTWTGLDLSKRRLGDSFELGVVDPLLIKESAIKLGSEAACQLVNIDRVLRGYHGATLLPGEVPPGASEGPKILHDAKDLPDETIKAYRNARYMKPYGSKTELNL